MKMRMILGAAAGTAVLLTGCSSTTSNGEAQKNDASAFNWQSGVTNVAFDPDTDTATWQVSTTAGNGNGQCSPSGNSVTCQFTQPFNPSGASASALSASSARYTIGPVTLNLSDGTTVTLNTCGSWYGQEGSISCTP